MQKMARGLAAKGHRLPMIEVMLAANGFRHAADFLEQANVESEMREIAARAGVRSTGEGEPETS
jgi:hypothetical protein